MDLYIDKANVLSFLESRAENMYEDCLKLMRKQLNVNFNFSKDELKKDESLMLWYRKNFTQGVENSEIRFESSFPIKPIQSTTSHTFDRHQLSSVYLLEDKNVRELKNTGRVIIGDVGEEIETLHKLFFLQGDYLFDKTWKIGAQSFQKWTDLEPFSLPLTDILIVDPYVVNSPLYSLSSSSKPAYIQVIISVCGSWKFSPRSARSYCTGLEESLFLIQ
jgi:hypothetical protein